MRSSVYILNRIQLTYDNDYNLKTTKEHYPHTHDFCEIYFHIAGKCTYMVENGIYPTDYGTCVITRQNELHCVRIEEDCQYERFYYTSASIIRYQTARCPSSARARICAAFMSGSWVRTTS